MFTYKERPYVFYLLRMTIFEFEFVESCDLHPHFLNLLDQSNYKYIINNQMDICIRVGQKYVLRK